MSSRSAISSGLCILVVDDEPAVAHVIATALIAEGHQVTTARNGTEALAIFKSGKWDLVMTDRMMPSKGGEQLAADIKAIDPNVPVIMVSGSLEPPKGMEVKLPNIDYVVRKPFRIGALTDAIAAVVVRG